jgi:hypothetical protein
MLTQETANLQKKVASAPSHICNVHMRLTKQAVVNVLHEQGLAFLPNLP